MLSILGSTFGIGVKKRLMKRDSKNKKQRTCLASGDTIKRIRILPINLNDEEIKVNYDDKKFIELI